MAVKMSRAKWKVWAPRDLLRLHPSMLNKVLGGRSRAQEARSLRGQPPSAPDCPAAILSENPGLRSSCS